MRVTIIADASYCASSGAAGYGFWIAAERGKKRGGGSMKGKVESSHTAEMLAVCNSLHIALASELVQPGDHVLMQTDCLAAIYAFENKREPKQPQEREALRFFRKLRREVPHCILSSRKRTYIEDRGTLRHKQLVRSACERRNAARKAHAP